MPRKRLTPARQNISEVATVADRVLDGEDFHFAVREFIEALLGALSEELGRTMA